MTLILDPDLSVLKIYLYTKDKVTRSRLSKARSRTVQTCRQIHRPMRWNTFVGGINMTQSKAQSKAQTPLVLICCGLLWICNKSNKKCCRAYGQAKQIMVSERRQKLRSYFSHYWTEVHEILKRCRRPLVVSNVVSRLSISCSLPEILALAFGTELRSRRK